MYHFNPNDYQNELVALLRKLEQKKKLSPKQLAQLVKLHAKPNGNVFSKDEIIRGYRHFAGKHGLGKLSQELISLVSMKPMRTQSGVSPVTVLTKPFPCPGQCIFCPNDVRMPKSYLADEPGAQRAERNWFDPYLQTYNRLQALHNIGHTVSKTEVIVLGGTWSFYPESYQIWFIKECFRALNDFGTYDGRDAVLEWYTRMAASLEEKNIRRSSEPAQNQASLADFQIDGEEMKTTYNRVISEQYTAPEMQGGFHTYQTASWEELEAQQKKNETASVRCVGLVIETRPDNISVAEVTRIRRLGCTKTQIGVQSLQDSVLEMNKRGHDVAATRKAFKLLRQAGFKIHAHWMANLYGSSVEADKKDFEQLFTDPDFHPDELKVYPCSLIGSAELMQYYKSGKWHPYTKEELAEVLVHVFKETPEYCRLTRVIRDIPSTDIVEGNKLTNFRQIVEKELEQSGIAVRDIRAREIKNGSFDPVDIQYKETKYQTSVSTEYFLQFVVPAEKVKYKHTQRFDHEAEKVLGFLRLSLPKEKPCIDELEGAAIVREVHVYGSVVAVGSDSEEKPQHLGLGKKLLEHATRIAQENNFDQLAVISGIGTKEYYRKRGFVDGKLYQFKKILEQES